jgi:hypothetical protein
MYNAEKFKQSFTSTDIFQKLSNDFDEIIFDKHFPDLDFVDAIPTVDTPRQKYGDKSWWKTYFSAVPFYYLQYLLETKPAKIYDLGCGWNSFQKYIPNVVGVGPLDPVAGDLYVDVVDYVDKHFIQQHQDKFEAVFSINALHFRPLSEIRNIVLEFYSMIAPGGRGWLAINAARMIGRDENFRDLPTEIAENYIREQLEILPESVMLLEIDLSCVDNWMDGNIQIIFEKNR